MKIMRPDIYDHKTVDWLEITAVGTKHRCQEM